MNGNYSVQIEITITICIWAFLVIALMITATWKKRLLDQPAVQPSPMRTKTAETLCGPIAERLALSPKIRAPAGHTPLQLELLSSIDTTEDRETQRRKAVATEELHSIEGTVKRVDYPKKELSLVAGQHVCHFALDSESHLWFDDRPAVLRCFHQLDHVKIIFTERDSIPVVKAMYAWEKQPTQTTFAHAESDGLRWRES